MHDRRSRLRLLVSFATLALALSVGGCFNPELPVQIVCGEGGTCPPGLRCETSANLCVSSAQAPVTELHYAAQPADVEATLEAPPVIVEIRDVDGRVVPLSGGTFAIELSDNAAGVNLLGSAASAATAGMVSFDRLRFDRPGRGLRLVVHGGSIEATSEPFDVITTGPAIARLNPANDLQGCASIPYRLQQAQGLPVDLLVEFDPDGASGPEPFRRATQGPSDPGKAGVQGVPGSLTGRARSFTWNTSADLDGMDASGELRITPRVGDVKGLPVTAPFTVRNGPHFRAIPVGGDGYPYSHMIDLDDDGRITPSMIDTVNGMVAVDENALTVPGALPVNDFAAGDLDGNGLKDVVMALSTTTIVMLQQRSPRLSFAPAIDAGTPPYQHLLAADLDHDGLTEIIGVEDTSGDVVVLHASRDRQGQLVERARPWTGGQTGHVWVADLDRDGWLDLVIGRSAPDAAVVVVRGTPVGLAAAAASDLTGDTLAVGDLDGDGRDDLAALDAGGLHVSSASGRVDVPSITGHALALADVDRDGRADVITATTDRVLVHAHVPDRAALAFRAPVLVGTATAVTDLYVGDWDRDGRVDVYASRVPDADSSMIFFIGTTPRRCGAGLGGPIDRSRDDLRVASAFADLDADGKIDNLGETLAIGRRSQLAVRHGLGDGTFSPASEPIYDWREGQLLRDLWPYDFDHDGFVDLAFARIDDESITLLYNDPAEPGSFTPVDLPTPQLRTLAIADLDDDGAEDLIFLAADRLQIRRGDASGQHFGGPEVLPTVILTGGPFSACRGTCKIFVQDLDGDADRDIMLQGDDEELAFLADPAAPQGFQAPIAIDPSMGEFVASAHLLPGPRPVLLFNASTRSIGNGSEAQVQYVAWRMDSSGTGFERVWEGPTITTSEPLGYGAVVGDFDADGQEEIFVDYLGVARISGGPSIELTSYPAAFRPQIQDLAAADVDGDGRDELLAAGYSGTVAVDLDEEGVPEAGDLLTPLGAGYQGGFGTAMGLGDFNGDGWIDVASVDTAAARVSLSPQSPTDPGHLGAGIRSIAGSWFVKLGDLDGDRRDDAVTYGADGSLLYLGLDDASPEARCTADAANWPLAIADVDRDGRVDLVTSGRANVELHLSPADTCAPPTPVMSLERSASTHCHPQALQVADLNLDGLLDVVVASDALRVALQDPDARGTFHTIDHEPGSDPTQCAFADIQIADLDRDGAPDIVALGVDAQIHVFMGDIGPTSWQLKPSSIVADGGGNSLTLGDVDGDGRLDIVACQSPSCAVLLQSETQGGTFSFAYRTLGPMTGFIFDNNRASLVDFDQDGRQDLVYVDPSQGTMLLRGR